MDYPKNRVQTDINITLTQLNLEVESLLSNMEIQHQKNVINGISVKQSSAALLSDVVSDAGLYRAFKNKMNRVIGELEKDFVARPINLFAQTNPTMLFKWVLGDVKTVHCPDCQRLSGMSARTISDWRKEGLGLPREGKTECNVGCNCALKQVK